MSYSVITADPSHIPAIARRVRQADMNELWAVAALSPREALEQCLADSEYALTWVIDEEPACIGGIVPSELGNIWMVGTALIDSHKREFLRESRRQFTELCHRYGALYNWVDARNVRAIRWLKWLGFDVAAKPLPYGVMYRPFYFFIWERAVEGREAA